ncbi:MAG: response regulator transcription factor [Oscillospiraceae bacterium]|nr:response regulator transcription factor [Oscillospiraceae bacterium]
MNIIVVDDDRLVAISLKTILEASGEVTVLEIGNSGEQAIELYEKYKPDILLMDIRMGGMTGIQAGEEILRKHSDAKILYLTTFSDDEYIVKALQIGTKGYILKQNFECIVPALRTVMEGQTVFGDDVINRLPSLMQKKSGIDYEKYGINDKEKEIIELIAEGLSNKEIASELFLSEGTVRNYLSSVLEKLDLRDRTQLAIFYYNNK